MNSRAYCVWFNFRGSDQQKRVKDLSGGERNRVHLARLLKDGGNLLLLDEPTNDLDVETLQALENALLGFPGCVVVISHDRWFLDRIATHILAFEGDSQVTWFAGNYQAYEEDRKKRLGEDAAQPHRMKFRKLVSVHWFCDAGSAMRRLAQLAASGHSTKVTAVVGALVVDQKSAQGTVVAEQEVPAVPHSQVAAPAWTALTWKRRWSRSPSPWRRPSRASWPCGRTPPHATPDRAATLPRGAGRRRWCRHRGRRRA